jgi:hypothetical protein
MMFIPRLLVCGVLSLSCLVPCLAADSAVSCTGDVTESGGPTRALGLYKPGRPVPLEEGFRDPPAISRVQCWWQLAGSAVTRQEITRELEEFKAKGMGGVTVKDTGPLMPRDEHTAHIKDIPFMSEPWLDMFAHVVSECERLGLVCRSRSGSGWNEGGPWIPLEMSTKILAFAKSEPITGPAKFAGEIPQNEKNLPAADVRKNDNLFVLAVNGRGETVVNLTDKVGPDARLVWDVPEGSWTLLSCVGRPSGKKLMSASERGDGLHHDHLNAEAADLHLRMLGGRMFDKLGGFENTAFDGFNSDGFEFGIPTWTPGLVQMFQKRCGYDPVPYLPVLAGYDLGETGQRFLYDFRTTVSDLIVENFYRYASTWCRSRKTAFEAQGVGGPSHRLPMDLIEACGAVDIPMGEAWAHGRSYAKIASSAAHAYGKRLVGLEYGTQKEWFFAPTPALLKMRADESFLLGANYLCLACVDYTPPEAGSPGWVHSQPCRIGLQQTWWPLARPFFDYLARCCFLLQSGTNVASVAVYNSFLTRQGMLWLAPDDDNLSTYPRQYGFDFVSDDLVQNHMRVQDGRIMLASGAAYQVLSISPPVLSSAGLERRPKPFKEVRVAMPLETLVKVRDLVRAGATVVWAGDPPTRSPSLRDSPQSDAEYASVAKELWQDRRLIKLDKDDPAELAALLDKSPQPPAWRVADDVPLRVVHRRTADADIFFLVNRSVLDDYPNMTELLAARNKDTGQMYDVFKDGKTIDASVLFRIQGRTPEFWLPQRGEIKPAPWKQTPGGLSVRVVLPPQASVFVVFRNSPTLPGENKTGSPDHATGVPALQSIDGPWDLEFPPGWGAPTRITLSQLKSWTELSDPNIRHFNGIATYRTTFMLSEASEKHAAAILDLGHVAAICEAWLNGERLGIAWCPPYQFDVTGKLHPGQNDVEIRVVNTWHNRLVADASLPKGKRVTRMYPEARYNRYRGRSLVNSGLVGPVQIIACP